MSVSDLHMDWQILVPRLNKFKINPIARRLTAEGMNELSDVQVNKRQFGLIIKGRF